MRDTPLNHEYQRRGLLRPRAAAKVLGIDPELFFKYVNAGQLQGEHFEWQGQPRDGYPYEYIEALRQKMLADG